MLQFANFLDIILPRMYKHLTCRNTSASSDIYILANYMTQILGFRFPHNEVILYAKYWIGTNRLIG